MGLGALLLRRTLQLVVLTALVTAATFGLAALVPGDFFTDLAANPNVSPEVVARLRSQYGLQDPLAARYLRWIARSLSLDLGFSLRYMRPVRDVLADALVHTAWLGGPALVLGLTVGTFLGSVHSLQEGRAVGRLLDVLCSVAISIPSLLLGIAAMLVAARSGWFPVGGVSSAHLEQTGAVHALLDRLHHLVLPLFCLTLPVAASVERIQHAAVRAAAREPYLDAGRARGLPRRTIFLQYLIRPALNPTLSVLGPLLAALLSGSLVLEHIFAWPGLGLVTYEALFNRDLFLLLGCVSTSCVLLVVGNAAADVLLHLLDPRTGRAGSPGSP